MPCEIIRPAAFNRAEPPDPPDSPPPAAAALDPRLPAHRAAFPPLGFRRREYSIFDLARALGIYERTTRDGSVRHTGDRTIIRHVRDLIDVAGLPAPIGIRIRRATAERGVPRSTVLEGAAAVDMRSRWDAALVDDWFDARATPRDRAVHERAELNHAAIALDANADRLFGRGGA